MQAFGFLRFRPNLYVMRFLLFPLILLVACTAPRTAVEADALPETLRVAFYNVENLFDTVDDPLTLDEEFTPQGKKQYTEARYAEKLDRLGEVIQRMDYPAIVGVSEVENRAVLEALTKTDRLRAVPYRIEHFDSPDVRGIDVGLLYRSDQFEPTGAQALPINFPASIVEDYTTRDVLIVSGKLAGEPVHVLVNHWPSRRGGLAASEPKRTYVAAQVRRAVDSISLVRPDAQFIIMGDFNDEPDNRSVMSTLGAQLTREGKMENVLFNTVAEQDKQGEGSYNYRGNWNMLDQIILSGNFLDDKGLQYLRSEVFQHESLLFDHPKNGLMPNRSYGGPNYYGGYSDHLPVFIELRPGR